MRFLRHAAALAVFLAAAPVGAVDLTGVPSNLPAVSSLNGWSPSFGVLYSSAGAPTAAGTGYVPNDTSTLTGGAATTQAVLLITDTKAVSGTVAAGGSGGSNGACTVTGTTGTGTKAQFTGTVSGGVLTGALTVAVAGDYTVNPTAIAVEPVTGCSLVGATVNMTMGALKFAVRSTGLYSAAPASPVAQGSSSGSGTGATFTLSFGPIAAGLNFPALSDESHSPGNDNMAIGTSALAALSGSYFNLAIGPSALKSNTTGPESVAIGWHAAEFYTGTGGAGIVCIGTASCRAATTPTSVVAIGTDAANSVTSPNGLIAIGHSAVGGTGNDIGSNNVMVGHNAGKFGSTSRVTNVVIGMNAALGKSDNTSGYSRMTVVGSGALAGANLGSPARSVVVGDIAGGSAFATTDSVLVGSSAGNAITSGLSITAIGSNALASQTSGNNLTVIGKATGQTTCVTATDGILIDSGNNSLDCAASNSSNFLNIAKVIAGDTTGATNPSVCAVGMKCVIGVLRSANFNSTADQSITIRPLTTTDTGYITKATKYVITDIVVSNCSASPGAAAGGFYTAASKGGTIIGAVTTPFTNCASTTTTHRLTGLLNQDTTVFTASTLYLSLTTNQGGAATGDVYIIGELVN